MVSSFWFILGHNKMLYRSIVAIGVVHIYLYSSFGLFFRGVVIHNVFLYFGLYIFYVTKLFKIVNNDENCFFVG